MKDRQIDNSKRFTRTAESDDSGVWGLFLLFIFFALVVSATAQAETRPVANAITTKIVREPRLKPSAEFVLDTARTLSENESDSWSGFYQLNLGLADKETSSSALLRLGYSREYSYERADGTDGDFDNPRLDLRKSFKSGDHFKSTLIDEWAIGARGILGVSRESKRRTYRGEFGPSISVRKKWGRFELIQAFRYGWRSYEYDIRMDGTVNSPHGFASSTVANLELTEMITLNGTFVYSHDISFQGVGRSAESTQFSLDCAWTKNFDTSIGFVTERPTAEADGQSERMKFFDQDKAQAFFDLILKI